MAEGIRERAHEKEWGSEVPLEEFAESVEGKREVLELEDNELVEEVRQELRKHNVTFAVEQDDQERFYLHVRGNDANLIAHALDRAQERLDALRTRDEPTQDRADDRDEPEQAQDTPDREGRQRTTPHQDSPQEPRFTTRSFEGEGWKSSTVDKSAALNIIGRIPADEEIPGRGLTEDMLSPLKDVRGWIGQDPDVDQAIAEKFPDLMTPEQLAVARSHDGPTPEQPEALSPEEEALTAREEAELAQRRDWVGAMNEVEDRVQKPVLREQLAETSGDFGPADELDRETAVRAAGVNFGNEWERYTAGRFYDEPTNIYAHSAGTRIAAAEPSIALSTAHSGAGTPTPDGGGVRLDAQGQFSVLDGHNIETITPQAAAERLGVSSEELERAVTAATAGLTSAQGYGERAETLDMQERLEEELSMPDPVAEAEIRHEHANDPTLGTLPDGYESITPENAADRSVPQPLTAGSDGLKPYDPNASSEELAAHGREVDKALAWAARNDPDAYRAHEHGQLGSDHPADSHKYDNALIAKYRSALTEGRSAPDRDSVRKFGDSREQSKATIRDKISAVADRLQRTAGRDAPTQVRGLDAHKKGPTR
ncbi:MAG TPA: DUF3801 domain-containing protein [Brachybacterium faecium]|nr:DUF3801 domain-containing protein [Brachybacterium faecium]